MTSIAGLILAGGQSRRMGGTDKSFVPLNGKPLIQLVIDRAGAQVDVLAINTNSKNSRYSDFGLPLVADVIAGFQGPLAGLQAGLTWLQTQDAEWLATFACDTPYVPMTCVETLRAAVDGNDKRAAYAVYREKRHPIIGLWHQDLLDAVDTWLTNEGRMMMAFVDEIGAVGVDFTEMSTDPFVNINTLSDLTTAAKFSS